MLCSTLLSSPQALEEWRQWLVEQKTVQDVPRFQSNYATTVPLWYSPLNIITNDTVAHFSQEFTIFKDTLWVSLPGGVYWPSNIECSTDNNPVIVNRNGTPSLLLPPGNHRVSGKIIWETQPDQLTIHKTNSIVNLILNESKIHNPQIINGKLTLKQENPLQVLHQADLVTIKLFRQLNDNIPQTIISRLELSITGSKREIDLGTLLPPNSEIVSLSSTIPALIDNEGKLKVQVTPGSSVITLVSRTKSIQNEFVTTDGNEDWPVQEVWSIQQNPTQRTFTVSGAPLVDPTQVQIPQQWRSLPAYILKSGDTLSLTETSRGNSNPLPNQLSLNRKLILDFDGNGFTVQDQINGTVYEATQLSLSSPYELGKATLNNEAQLVIHTDSGIGIGIKKGNITLNGVGRIESSISKIPTIGWDSPMERFTGTLLLPPGWDIFHIMGTDSVSHSKIDQWDLWDIFLVLLIIVLAFKFLGLKWSIPVSAMLLLLYHTAGAPQLSWLNIFIAGAILIKLPEHRGRNILRAYYVLSLILITISILPLTVSTVREILYPNISQSEYLNVNNFMNTQQYDVDFKTASYEQEVSNEEAYFTGGGGEPQDYDQQLGGYASGIDAVLQANDVNYSIREGSGFGANSGGVDDLLNSLKSVSNSPREYYQQQAIQQEKLKTMATDDNLQTGPGVPTWGWNSCRFSIEGKVDTDHELKLYLITPTVNRILKLISITLLIAIIIRLFKVVKDTPMVVKKSNPKPVATTLLFLLSAILLPQQLLADEYPPQYLFNRVEQEVTTELNKTPLWFSQSAEMRDGKLELTDSSLMLTMNIPSRNELVAFPVLQGVSGWIPDEIRVGERSQDTQYSYLHNNFTVNLSKGSNRVTLSGDIQGNGTALTFPSTIHNLEVVALGWSVEGIEKGTVPGRTIRLTRTVVQETKEGEFGTQPPAPLFCRVDRSLYFGYEQTAQTTITRIAPFNSPVTLKIPLLPNEAVITPDMKIDSQFVTVTLPANSNFATYESRFPMNTTLALIAPNSNEYSETWNIESDSRFRITTSGLTPIVSRGQVQSWLPRSGDTLTVSIIKPDAVIGNTTTIESANLAISGNKTSTKSTLTLSVNSSRGEPMWAILPDNAEVEELHINGQQALNYREDTLTIPLTPGVQNISLKWSSKQGITSVTKTDLIELSEPGVNCTITYSIPPESRWLLALSGPIMGPSVIVWSIIIVLLIIAILLPKFAETALNTPEWLLLFVGVASVNYIGILPILFWMILFSYRLNAKKDDLIGWKFNLMQIILVGITVIAMLTLVSMIPVGLLSSPAMIVKGNGSSSYFYQWYQDRTGTTLPQGTIYSLPFWAYRTVRLLWSVWIAVQIPKWLKWVWKSFSSVRIWSK